MKTKFIIIYTVCKWENGNGNGDGDGSCNFDGDELVSWAAIGSERVKLLSDYCILPCSCSSGNWSRSSIASKKQRYHLQLWEQLSWRCQWPVREHLFQFLTLGEFSVILLFYRYMCLDGPDECVHINECFKLTSSFAMSSRGSVVVRYTFFINSYLAHCIYLFTVFNIETMVSRQHTKY